MRMMTLGAACATSALALATATAPHAQTAPVMEVSHDVHHDVSPPLRYLAHMEPPRQNVAPRVIPLHRIPHPQAAGPAQQDGALQRSVAGPVPTVDGLNFAGVGNGDYGYTVQAVPPDTNGAVGATQYVQMVNTAFGIFDKTTGALLLSVKNNNVIWAGFGGGCETSNDGDPIVKYDRIANRWIITQLQFTTQPYLECVAVSTTSDATGAYFRYSFSFGNNDLNDYPKISVWPDAYYSTYNIFTSGEVFNGARVCAWSRPRMLQGKTALQQCFQLPGGETAPGGLLASDLDGAKLPPRGSPNYLVDINPDTLTSGANSLNLWKFHVDFVNPANTTFTGPVTIPVPAFTTACSLSPTGSCIPQEGTDLPLDSVGDRLMYRLAYRNFGTHESLVVSHSVAAGVGGATAAAVRWYELRRPGTVPIVFQSGTYAPDGVSRWMGSIAMDKVGDIAVGYSASSSAIFPAIRYTGRVPTDALGTLEAEKTVMPGGGSQNLPTTEFRWGDYTSMSVDPTDDCTFFYTNEYLKSSGQFNWSTQINTFKFPNCQ